MGRLNKRRRKLLGKLILNTRINADLLRYIGNRICRWRLDREKSTVVAHPTNGMIELGNVCNLHCQMCPREYEYGQAMDKGFMPLERATAIIDEMYPYLDSIGLTGLGETMMYPHLLEVVRYIKQRKRSIITTISTNAHFKGYQAAITPVLPYVDNIQFSVDGVGKVYETVRPNTSFQVIQDNIRYTMQRGRAATYMLNCVVMPENYQDMKNIVSFAREMGILYVNFNCASIASRPQRDRSYYGFYLSEAYQQAVEEVRQFSRQFPEMEVTGLDYPKDATFHDCIFPWEYPYITWDGYYVPCCGKPFPKLLNFGNVFEQGVMPVLNSRKAQAFRRAWQKNTPPSFCHNCQLTNI